MCVFTKSQTEVKSSGVIGFRFSVKMPCVVVQWGITIMKHALSLFLHTLCPSFSLSPLLSLCSSFYPLLHSSPPLLPAPLATCHVLVLTISHYPFLSNRVFLPPLSPILLPPEVPVSSVLCLSSVRELPVQVRELYAQGFVLVAVHPFVHSCGPRHAHIQRQLHRAVLVRETPRYANRTTPLIFSSFGCNDVCSRLMKINEIIHSSSFCHFIVLTWKPIETHYLELCTSPPSLDVKLIADESATKKCLILAHCSNSFTFVYTWYYTIHCASLLSPSSSVVTMKLPLLSSMFERSIIFTPPFYQHSVFSASHRGSCWHVSKQKSFND